MNGLVCGRYRITDKLGEGGMAEIYAAKHELIDQDAAVKLLKPQMSAQRTIVKRFLNEAQAAAAVKHPGIVDIYDVGYTEDGRAYIVMERLLGETLYERLEREGRLSVDAARVVIRQLAGVIAAAHGRGIMHRDLKPDNIFLVPDPEVQGGERVKVLDFGIAKLTGDFQGSLVTAQGAVFGTPFYMAPEQCMDSGNVDERADLYSIGCIFYRCICGQPPFSSGDPIAVLGAHITQAPVPPVQRRPDVPVDIDILIMRLLAKSPGQRVQSCTELIAALDGGAGGVTAQPVQAAPEATLGMANNAGTPAGADAQAAGKRGNRAVSSSEEATLVDIGGGGGAGGAGGAGGGGAAAAAGVEHDGALGVVVVPYPSGQAETERIQSALSEAPVLAPPRLVQEPAAEGRSLAARAGEVHGTPGRNRGAPKAGRTELSARVGKVHGMPGRNPGAPRAGRTERRRWVFGAFCGFLAILGTVGGVLWASGGKGEHVSEPRRAGDTAGAGEHTSGPGMPEEVLLKPVVSDEAAAAPESEFDKHLGRARAAVAGRSWDGAMEALEQARAVGIDEAERMQQVDELGALVQAGQRQKVVFDGLQGALAADELDAVVQRFAEIPADSVYRADAERAIAGARERLEGKARKRADELVRRGRCSELSGWVSAIRPIVPTIWEGLNPLLEQCAARSTSTISRQGGKKQQLSAAERAHTLAALEEAYKHEEHRQVVTYCQELLRAGQIASNTAMQCGVAACRQKAFQDVAPYYKRLRSALQKAAVVRQVCLSKGHDPDA